VARLAGNREVGDGDTPTGRDHDPRALRVAVVGAGMAGILTAIRLQETGLDDFTVYEKAEQVGGTWRENTYPGLACDVPSHLYSYSFAPNPEWSHRFSPGPEIQAYFEQVAREHGVDRRVRFGDAVVSCVHRDGRWHVTTEAGHHDVVDIVIAATGVLHHPHVPDIHGLETFGGAMFHSARWDHGVTLDGARLGIVGTGSTAVQIVAAVVDRVAHLTLFQRTAQWILPQENPPYTEDEKAAYRADPATLVETHAHLGELFAVFSNAVVDASSPQIKVIEDLCLANLEENVTDPELRERLRPTYRAACKRLVVSPDFYQAIQRPNAELVTAGIERVERAGVRTRDGRLHELDVLVLATGFRTDAFVRPMTVVGRGGRRLDDEWASRPTAYLSISVPDFPNFFMINGPNGPVGNFSLIEVAELQVGYILQLVDRIRSGDCREICATREAMEAFEAERVDATQHTIWSTGCRSWYLDDRGVPASWPWSFDRFRTEMRSPRLGAYELA
jgi:cation diffusion facilitator CzcD-associated flavoprotein CzcO